MIETLLLVSTLAVAFMGVVLVKALPANLLLEILQTKRSGRAPGWAMGLLLFVAVIYLSYAFLIPILTVYLGIAGALIGGLLALVVIYFIYAFLVKKTGAKPTL